MARSVNPLGTSPSVAVLPRYPGPVWGNVTPTSAGVRACHRTMPDNTPKRNEKRLFLASFMSGYVGVARESHPCQGTTHRTFRPTPWRSAAAAKWLNRAGRRACADLRPLARRRFNHSRDQGSGTQGSDLDWLGFLIPDFLIPDSCHVWDYRNHWP